MYLNREVNNILATLKSSDNLEDIRFIKAYPYVKKGTVLKNKVAAVSSGEVNLETISLDNDDYCGKYSIDIELFVPFNFGSPVANDDIERIFLAVMDASVCAVKMHPITKDSIAECYRAKVSFYYNLNYERE